MSDLPPPPPPPPGFLPPEGARPAAAAAWSSPGGTPTPSPGDPRAAFALPAASWWSRAGALLLDGLVMVLLAAAVAALVAAITDGDSFTFTSEDADGVETTDELPYWAAWGVGVGILIAMTYPWVMLGLMRGRTPGRRAAGIRVVTYDGSPIGMGRAFVREGVVKGLLGFVSLPLVLSYLWPLWDPHQRALHDLVISTRVVRDTGNDDPQDAFGGGAPAATAPAGWTPPRPDRRDDDLAGRIGLGG